MSRALRSEWDEAYSKISSPPPQTGIHKEHRLNRILRKIRARTLQPVGEITIYSRNIMQLYKEDNNLDWRYHPTTTALTQKIKISLHDEKWRGAQDLESFLHLLRNESSTLRKTWHMARAEREECHLIIATKQIRNLYRTKDELQIAP